MPLYKNVASQKIPVFAWDTANDAPKTGNAAAITAQISKDGGACAATNDANPTELDATDAPGIYIFDMLQAETNADMIVLFAKSSTADITLEPVIIYTTVTPIAANVTQWNGTAVASPATAGIPDINVKNIANAAVNTSSAQLGVNVVNWKGSAAQNMTGDAFSVVNSGTYGNSALKTLIDTVDTVADNTYTRIGAPAGASVSADVAAVKSDTGAILTDTGTTLDGKVDAIQAKTDGLNFTGNYVQSQVKGQDNIDFGALQKASITAAVFDYVVENSKSFAVMFRIAYAMLVNKVSGGGTDTVTFRDDGDSKNRITMTVDSDGNRSAVVKDGTV